MSNNLNTLSLHLAVFNCFSCGGNHEQIDFVPYQEGNWTHRGICPVNQGPVWMNVLAEQGTWEKLLIAAGVDVKDA